MNKEPQAPSVWAFAVGLSNLTLRVVWESASTLGDGQSNTTRFLQSMARSLPPLLQVMKDIGGVEMPQYVARLTPDGAPKNGVTAESAPAAPPPKG
jgi:flotillin